MQKLYACKGRHQKRQQLRRLAYSAFLLTATSCVLLLTGCAATSVPPPTACPVLPAIPPALTPQPSPSYSEQWRLLVEQSRTKLMATPLTQ